MLWVLSVTQIRGLNDVQAGFVVLRTKWNLTVSPTALCKLGHKRGLLKKRKMDIFFEKKKRRGP